jgi:hypothetical protein
MIKSLAADVTGGKPIIAKQFISGVKEHINLLVSFL